MKKLFALVLAVVMVMGCSTAFALTDGGTWSDSDKTAEVQANYTADEVISVTVSWTDPSQADFEFVWENGAWKLHDSKNTKTLEFSYTNKGNVEVNASSQRTDSGSIDWLDADKTTVTTNSPIALAGTSTTTHTLTAKLPTTPATLIVGGLQNAATLTYTITVAKS